MPGVDYYYLVNKEYGLKKYKLISFDMFQTLVDVNTQKDAVMRRLFGNEYSSDKADKLWKDFNTLIFSYFHNICEGDEGFRTVARIFEQCYTELFPKHGIKLEPKEGAYILSSAHADSLLYDDVKEFVERIQDRYMTCVISDTDTVMIEKILDQFSFDFVFTSEEYQSYKSDGSSRLFNAAFSMSGIEPHEMLHIGDGLSDIAGSKMAGADAAWINRGGKEWRHAIKPDYIVSSLLEIPI